MKLIAILIACLLPSLALAQTTRSELPKPCLPLTACTYNFAAITPHGAPRDFPAYIRDWPGVLIDEEVRDQHGAGNIVPGFATREAGVGIWWYWLIHRTNQRRGNDPNGTVTLLSLATSIAGNPDRQAQAVQVYLNAYRSYAQRFFDRPIAAEEPLPLSDPDTVWNLARVMFQHEIGEVDLSHHLTRAQFEMGLKLGRAYRPGLALDVRDYIAAPE